MSPRIKIVKKRNKTFDRFESDRHARLDVSNYKNFILNNT